MIIGRITGPIGKISRLRQIKNIAKHDRVNLFPIIGTSKLQSEVGTLVPLINNMVGNASFFLLRDSLTYFFSCDSSYTCD